MWIEVEVGDCDVLIDIEVVVRDRRWFSGTGGVLFHGMQNSALTTGLQMIWSVVCVSTTSMGSDYCSFQRSCRREENFVSKNMKSRNPESFKCHFSPLRQ